MAPPTDGPFVVTVVAESGGGPSKCFELAPGQDRVVRIGRAKENEVVVDLKGSSWVHAELRPRAAGAEGGASGARLLVRDCSTNGTGMKAPNASLVRLVKDEDTPVPDGATLVLPLKVKTGAGADSKDLRTTLLIRVQAAESGGAQVTELETPPPPEPTPKPAPAPAAPAPEPEPTPAPTPVPAEVSKPAESAPKPAESAPKPARSLPQPAPQQESAPQPQPAPKPARSLPQPNKKSVEEKKSAEVNSATASAAVAGRGGAKESEEERKRPSLDEELLQEAKAAFKEEQKEKAKEIEAKKAEGGKPNAMEEMMRRIQAFTKEKEATYEERVAEAKRLELEAAAAREQEDVEMEVDNEASKKKTEQTPAVAAAQQQQPPAAAPARASLPQPVARQAIGAAAAAQSAAMASQLGLAGMPQLGLAGMMPGINPSLAAAAAAANVPSGLSAAGLGAIAGVLGMQGVNASMLMASGCGAAPSGCPGAPAGCPATPAGCPTAPMGCPTAAGCPGAQASAPGVVAKGGCPAISKGCMGAGMPPAAGGCPGLPRPKGSGAKRPLPGLPKATRPPGAMPEAPAASTSSNAEVELPGVSKAKTKATLPMPGVSKAKTKASLPMPGVSKAKTKAALPKPGVSHAEAEGLPGVSKAKTKAEAAAPVPGISKAKASIAPAASAQAEDGALEFLVDNSKLNADTVGMAVRASMNLQDRLDKQVSWGQVVSGVVVDGKWLKLAEGQFLPMEVNGTPVVFPKETAANGAGAADTAKPSEVEMVDADSGKAKEDQLTRSDSVVEMVDVDGKESANLKGHISVASLESVEDPKSEDCEVVDAKETPKDAGAEQYFLVDNSELKAPTDGIALRAAKMWDDKTQQQVRWGTILRGVDEGDGWVKIGEHYLPTTAQPSGARLLVPQDMPAPPASSSTGEAPVGVISKAKSMTAPPSSSALAGVVLGGALGSPPIDAASLVAQGGSAAQIQQLAQLQQQLQMAQMQQVAQMQMMAGGLGGCSACSGLGGPRPPLGGGGSNFPKFGGGRGMPPAAAAANDAVMKALGEERCQKIRRFVESFQNLEKRHEERICVAMSKRIDTFDADLDKLTASLESARNPPGLLAVKLREMEEGTFGSWGGGGGAARRTDAGGGGGGFFGQSGASSEGLESQREELDAFAKKWELDDRLRSNLARQMAKRESSFKADMASLDEVLKTARSPPGLLHAKLREMEDGVFERREPRSFGDRPSFGGSGGGDRQFGGVNSVPIGARRQWGQDNSAGDRDDGDKDGKAASRRPARSRSRRRPGASQKRSRSRRGGRSRSRRQRGRSREERRRSRSRRRRSRSRRRSKGRDEGADKERDEKPKEARVSRFSDGQPEAAPTPAPGAAPTPEQATREEEPN